MKTLSLTSSQDAVYVILETFILPTEPVKFAAVKVADVSVTFVNTPG
jgi:hypothetical protein